MYITELDAIIFLKNQKTSPFLSKSENRHYPIHKSGSKVSVSLIQLQFSMLTINTENNTLRG